MKPWTGSRYSARSPFCNSCHRQAHRKLHPWQAEVLLPRPKCMIWSNPDTSLDCTPSMNVPASVLTLSTVFSDRNERSPSLVVQNSGEHWSASWGLVLLRVHCHSCRRLLNTPTIGRNSSTLAQWDETVLCFLMAQQNEWHTALADFVSESLPLV